MVQSRSQSASDSSSTPAAPWFALTRFEAFHTSRLEIEHGLAVCTASSHGWLTSTTAERYPPFAPPPFQGLPHYDGGFRPCAPRRDAAACGATTRGAPLASRRQGPTFHTPAWIPRTPSVCRTPLRPEAGDSCTPPGVTTGSSCDVVPTLSTPRQWFACARLRDPYLTRSCQAVSSPLTTRALAPRSVRGFAAASCKAAARGRPSSCVQQGCLRVLTSYTLLRAVVAHSRPRNAPGSLAYSALCALVDQHVGTSCEVSVPDHQAPYWQGRD